MIKQLWSCPSLGQKCPKNVSKIQTKTIQWSGSFHFHCLLPPETTPVTLLTPPHPTRFSGFFHPSQALVAELGHKDLPTLLGLVAAENALSDDGANGYLVVEKRMSQMPPEWIKPLELWKRSGWLLNKHAEQC